MFMLTNNSYTYVDLGCKKIFESIVNDKSFGVNHWAEIFDVVMMLGHKPGWYDNKNLFRVYDPKTDNLSVRTVQQFKRGEIYYGGSFSEFQRISSYPMSKVLYMGDNIYSDLSFVHFFYY